MRGITRALLSGIVAGSALAIGSISIASTFVLGGLAVLYSPTATAAIDPCLEPSMAPYYAYCATQTQTDCAADPTSLQCALETAALKGLVCANTDTIPFTGCVPYVPPPPAAPPADPNAGPSSNPYHGDTPSLFGPGRSDPAPTAQRPSAMRAYMQFVADNAGTTISLEEFTATWDLNQPGITVNFNDGGPTFDDSDPNDAASTYDSSMSDPWSIEDDFSSSPSIPDLQTVDSAAINSDNGSGDTSNVCCTSSGDPINTATGNLFEVQRDFVGQGPFPIRYLRFYNSLMQASAVPSATELGNGWRGSYDSAVVVLSSASVPTAVVVRPTGRSLEFTNPSGTQWVAADPTVRASLSSQADASGNIAGWTYVTADDVTERYSAAGQLLSIANRAGLTQTLAYNLSGQLTSVTDAFGHQMSFTYNAQGQLEQATDPAGGHYQYAYGAAGNLVAVTYPDGTSRQYLYENSSFPSALTGLIDENGSRYATWTYDGQGRAVSSVLAGGVEPVSISYNADGSSTVTDARGTVRQHTYEQVGGGALRPVSTAVVSCAISCPLLSSNAAYDANGVFTSGTDANGNVTALTFDARGLLSSRTEAAGTALARTVSITWHALFHEPTEITFPDCTVSFTYDAQGNRTAQTISAGGVTRKWTYAYNAQGLMTQLAGPRTDVPQAWNFTYDAQGNVSSIEDPLGHLARITAYDAWGHPLTIVDPNGVTSTFTFDARGRLIAHSVGARTWTYQRDAVGQITKMTYPNGATVSLTYDAAHRLTDAVYSTGIRKHRVLTPAGDVTDIQLLDAANTVIHQQILAVDGLGRITSVTDANGQSTTFRFDSNGNLVASTDALGRTSSLTYDALNRPTSATDALGQTTSIQYNPYDEPTEVTAPNGAITRYAYNVWRERIQEASPDRGVTTLTYTAAGQPAARTDARGVTASFAFDALNRLTQISYSSPSASTPPAWIEALGTSILSDNASFTYDQGPGCTNGIGRLCARQDQSGTESYSYDPYGDITQQTHVILGYSYATLYDYDLAGRLTQEIYPDGRVISYSRDALERITDVGGTVNNVASAILSGVQYRADGAPVSLTFGNGLIEARTYDPVGRLIKQVVGNADTRTYTFDAVGNLTARQTNAESDQFGYDALNRLTTEQLAQGSTATNDAYAYDPNGNRLSESLNGSITPLSYTPDTNRLTAIGSATLTLDAAGKTIADRGGTRAFYYSAAGRLQWISQNGLPIAAYLYNGVGQRVGKLTLAGISLYHYDVFGRLISETTVGSAPSRDYVWAGSVPVAQIDRWVPIGDMLAIAGCAPGADGKIDWVSYLHTDSLSAPRLATDAEQHAVWRWDGEAFGATAAVTNPTQGAYPITVNLRYAGQYFDQETGLFYNGYRYYDSQTGRYVTSDPSGLMGGTNTYAYAEANPLVNSDTLGLTWYYQQSTGRLWHSTQDTSADAGIEYVGVGYSGYGPGLNNPDFESVPYWGPIPQGTYDIGAPYDSASTGPNTLPLSAEIDTNTYGRSGFLIHGDNPSHNYSASEGCIVAGPSERAAIINSSDTVLDVVP